MLKSPIVQSTKQKFVFMPSPGNISLEYFFVYYAALYISVQNWNDEARRDKNSTVRIMWT